MPALVSAVKAFDPDRLVLGGRVEAPEDDAVTVWRERGLAVELSSRRVGKRVRMRAVGTHQDHPRLVFHIKLEHDLPRVRRPVRVDGIASHQMRQLAEAVTERADRVQLHTARRVRPEHNPAVLTGRRRRRRRSGGEHRRDSDSSAKKRPTMASARHGSSPFSATGANGARYFPSQEPVKPACSSNR
jgi:hypothetical protein